MIEVISTGALATVQDLGRVGALNLGVGTSGAMDPMALTAGNILLGNADDAAGIELPILPFVVRFTMPAMFAITGADCAATLDNAPVLPWWVVRAEAGQILTLNTPSPHARWRAARAYLCLAGGIDVPVQLGSRSTQLRGAFGGLDGRPLRAGDRLRCGESAPVRADIGITPPVFDLGVEVDGLPALRVLPAAEFDDYTPHAHEVLWSSPWKITAQSDRYDYRLAGAALTPLRPLEMRSHGIVPGVIQVPPNGQPIIQMRDAQPSGGYPKIGTVIEADLWRLGQAPVGSSIRFLHCTWAEALAASEANDRWLANLRRLAGLHRLRAAP